MMESVMSSLRALQTARLSLHVAVVVAIVGVSPLQAQTPSADAMAFPRQVLAWYLAGEAQQVWSHAGPMLRELSESPDGLREAAAEITDSMGPEVAVLGEQLFAHPEGGGMQVYVRTVRHSQVPELFWIVTFSPANRQVQMIMPQPRQTIRSLFPQVKVP
jgi:hypothetical protein